MFSFKFNFKHCSIFQINSSCFSTIAAESTVTKLRNEVSLRGDEET